MINQSRTTIFVPCHNGELSIRYLGPIGLRGGRYVITASEQLTGRKVDLVCNLTHLVTLDGALVAEIKRAETGAARPT